MDRPYQGRGVPQQPGTYSLRPPADWWRHRPADSGPASLGLVRPEPPGTVAPVWTAGLTWLQLYAAQREWREREIWDRVGKHTASGSFSTHSLTQRKMHGCRCTTSWYIPSSLCIPGTNFWRVSWTIDESFYVHVKYHIRRTYVILCRWLVVGEDTKHINDTVCTTCHYFYSKSKYSSKNWLTDRSDLGDERVVLSLRDTELETVELSRHPLQNHSRKLLSGEMEENLSPATEILLPHV